MQQTRFALARAFVPFLSLAPFSPPAHAGVSETVPARKKAMVGVVVYDGKKATAGTGNDKARSGTKGIAGPSDRTVLAAGDGVSEASRSARLYRNKKDRRYAGT